MCTEKHKEFLKKASKEVESWSEQRRACFGLLWKDRNPEKVKEMAEKDKPKT
jgi:hypothetical protein